MSTTTAGRFVGQKVKRVEDPRLLTGRGRYVDDVNRPGMLHAAFVRSDLPRARITSIDTSAARALPGVHAVLTAADLDNAVGSMQPTMWAVAANPPSVCAPLHPLAGEDVRFVGDPVAVVVAESRYVAEDACELVDVEYEMLDAVVDYETAGDSSELVHAELDSNVAMDVGAPASPDLEALFSDAAHVVTETLHQHRHTNVPMETRGVVADYRSTTGELDVELSTQNPHEVRQVCARFLGVPEQLVGSPGTELEFAL